MTAETLRRAAALMRERAEAATPGPWSAADEHELLGGDAEPAWCVSRMRPGYESMSPTEGYMYDLAETSINGRHQEFDGPNAEHIASWHPAVALAVADWLDAVAWQHEFGGNDGGLVLRHAALTVAETYLGENESFRPEEDGLS